MKFAVYFPGIGYHCDKPLLYYGRNIARECGYEQYINLSYTTNIRELKGNADNMKAAFEELYEQVEYALKDIDWSLYDDILFMSKSVGTILASAYARKHHLCCRNIYYTPLAQTFDFKPHNGIAFTGTCDSWVDTDIIIRECRQTAIPLHIIENANHSLEVSSVMVNLDNMKKIMEITAQYLQS